MSGRECSIARATGGRYGRSPKRTGAKNRLALLELEGAPAGYAIYRHEPSWEGGSSTGRVAVVEAIAASRTAVAEIWRFLLDIDWAETVSASLIPPDHPLFFLLREPRRMRYRRGDGLWVRLVDVGAALAGRAYASRARRRLRGSDAFCPWNEGRWHLAGATAERTEAPADLALDAATLGSAYLGGLGFAQLEQAGLVDELTPGAIDRADSAFRHGLHPWCPEIF